MPAASLAIELDVYSAARHAAKPSFQQIEGQSPTSGVHAKWTSAAGVFVIFIEEATMEVQRVPATSKIDQSSHPVGPLTCV